MVGQEFIERILELGQSWLPAREIVKRGMNERFVFYINYFINDGKILIISLEIKLYKVL